VADLDFRALWEEALDYETYVEQSQKNRALWTGVYRTARIPDWAYETACEHGPGLRLLILAEDWCGDASNTVPVLARMGHEARCLDAKILRRDEYPQVMDRYLTNGSRSIPIVIVLGPDFEECGHWGPRPAELQQWVIDNKDRIAPDERYKEVRRWYARDRGVTTLREVLSIVGNPPDA
jgi:hypothetical protein